MKLLNGLDLRICRPSCAGASHSSGYRYSRTDTVGNDRPWQAAKSQEVCVCICVVEGGGGGGGGEYNQLRQK